LRYYPLGGPFRAPRPRRPECSCFQLANPRIKRTLVIDMTGRSSASAIAVISRCIAGSTLRDKKSVKRAVPAGRPGFFFSAMGINVTRKYPLKQSPAWDII